MCAPVSFKVVFSRCVSTCKDSIETLTRRDTTVTTVTVAVGPEVPSTCQNFLSMTHLAIPIPHPIAFSSHSPRPGAIGSNNKWTLRPRVLLPWWVVHCLGHCAHDHGSDPRQFMPCGFVRSSRRFIILSPRKHIFTRFLEG